MTGYELDLVKSQYAEQLGIFKCDDWSVFTDHAFRLGPDVKTTPIGSLDAPMVYWGGASKHPANAKVFIKAWHALVREGKFRRALWTVKVDPDTVLLVDRLRVHLARAPRMGEASYFSNTHGPLEIVSTGAVELFGSQAELKCGLQYQDNSGEDGFIHACMEALGAAKRKDTKLLENSEGVQVCGKPSMVAFHPRKDVKSWMACIAEATSATGNYIHF
jgi:hypothetical protein